MLATTIEIVRSGLKADPSLTPADRARLAEFAQGWRGGINVLINNAGVSHFRLLENQPAEEVDLALTFGNQAAIAIHNAETFAQERQVNRLEQLFRRAAGLATGDRQLVEGVLQAASRLVELRCPAGMEQGGARNVQD